MYDVVRASWRSFFESADGMNIQDFHQQQQLVSSPDLDSSDNIASGKGTFENPFVADAIITIPPSFPPIH